MAVWGVRYTVMGGEEPRIAIKVVCAGRMPVGVSAWHCVLWVLAVMG